jgi:hypothetical protein
VEHNAHVDRMFDEMMNLLRRLDNEEITQKQEQEQPQIQCVVNDYKKSVSSHE